MIGAFDLFKIGIGPSSSHTVGPIMKTKYKETAMGGLAAVVLDSPVGVNLADC